MLSADRDPDVDARALRSEQFDRRSSRDDDNGRGLVLGDA
jgi:hypothetical protein